MIGLPLLMAACVMVGLLALWLPSRSGVTKDNFERIETGMSRADVEKILGGKADDRGDVVLARSGLQIDILGLNPPSSEGWGNPETGDVALVEFDDAGHVRAKAWWPSNWIDDRTPWEKLLDRLPWREKRFPVPVRITTL
jgi:hypothetical protein